MPSEAVLLEACHLTRRRPDGQRRLLQDVSLSLMAGTRLSVAGPSGAGKTLLLRALALLDPLDGGEVRFQGVTVRRDAIPRFRREVIYLHQRPALWDETVADALERPYRLAIHRDQQFQRRRIVEALEFLGRDESFLAKRAGDLSGGEGQLVALLRAWQLDPTVMLLDEPTSGLDPGTAAAVEKLLTLWVDDRPEARATVWVTHDARQAARVADRTLLIRDGQLAEDAAPT